MSIKDEYTVRRIPKEQTYEWLLKKHYAHRLAPTTYSFGLYDNANILQGVCTLGTPLCSQLQGVCEGYTTVELNRLVVAEGLPSNTLSYFVSTLLNNLPKPLVVVSYSDMGQGHHGYIYQATNFIYTGVGAGGWGWAVKGLEGMHHTSVEDSVGRYEDRVAGGLTLEQMLRNKYGDKLYKEKQDPKHRYIYLCANKLEKKKMLNKLSYTPMPYPKGDNQRYDASYEPTRQGILI